jgi:hypothetical protein
MITQEHFSTLVYIWIGIGIATFVLLQKITAPYGRHTSNHWGPMINNKLGWFIMELPALAIPTYYVLKSGDLTNALVCSASFLWISHYFHRVVIFPFRIHTGNKKIPLVIVFTAIFFNLVNGFINGYWLAYFAPDLTFSWPEIIRLIAGLIIFLSGFIINQYHDKILIGLRTNSIKGYQIPYGGLFKYVSCPNFLGEIIEWLGFAIFVWSLPGFAFFVWTFVNLVPRALDHHKWYKGHFKEYPAERKAVFPHII